MTDIRILIIEDNAPIAMNLKDKLEGLEYTVCGIAHTGEEGVQLADELRPDLVLVDIKLPGEMDGVEAAGVIRSRIALPVIYLTGYADTATQQRAKVTEPYGYIVKPFDLAGLQSTIEMAIHKHALERELEKSEEKYRTIVENSPAGIVIMDDSFRFTFVNDQLCEILGYLYEEIIGKDFRIFLDDESKELITERYIARQKGEQVPSHYEAHLIRKDNQRRCIEIAATTIQDLGGEVRTVAQILDITVAKQAEAELRKHRDHLEKLVEERSAELAETNEQLQQEIEERVRAEISLQQRSDELSILNTLSHQVSASLLLDQVVEATLKGIVDYVAPDLVVFYIRQEDELILQDAHPKYLTSQDVYKVHWVGKCLCGLAVSQKKPVFSSDISTDSRCSLEECKQAGMQSFAALPLLSGEDVLGVLGVATAEVRDFSQTVDFMQALCGEVAIGLQNALLHQKVQSHASELEQEVIDRKQAEAKAERLLSQQISINELSMALGQYKNLDDIYRKVNEHIQGLMDVRAFIVSIYDPETRLIRAEFLADGGTLPDVSSLPPIPLGEDQPGTQSHVILTGEPLYIPDYAEVACKSKVVYTIKDDGTMVEGPPPEDTQEAYTKSILYSPMKIAGETFGVMQVQSTRLNAYSQEDLDLFTGMTNVVAIAVHNARLFDRLGAELEIRRQTEEELNRHHEHLEELVQERTKELVRANENLRKEDERRRQQSTALESVANAVVITDLEGNITWVNPAFTRLTGYAREEVIGSHTRILKSGKHDQSFYQQLWGTILAGKVWRGKLTNKRKDGRLYVEEMTITPVVSAQGEISQFVAIKEDITERIQAETALRESEERYRQVVELSPMLITLQTDQKITYINSAGVKLLGGSSPDEIIGKSLADYIHPDQREEVIEWFNHYTREKHNTPFSELTIIRSDGQMMELEIAAIVKPQNGVETVQVIARDIAEQKKLRESLRRQAALAGIELDINQPRELSSVLDQVARITTRLLPASGGVSVALWDDNSEDFWTSNSTVPQPSKPIIDQQIQKRNSVTQWILTNKRPVVMPDMSKDPFGPNTTLIQQNFQAYVGVPMLVENEVLGLLFVFDKHIRDYTRDDLDFLAAMANRAALAIAKVRLYETLQRARYAAEENARAKAQFLANMSHELRTPLTAVVSLSELLQETQLDPRQNKLITTIIASAYKLLALIDDILDFSKLEADKFTLKKQPLDLRACIEESLDLVALDAKQKGLNLAYYVDEETPNFIYGDAIRLGQILTNLLSNAVKFTERGEIYLHVSPRRAMISDKVQDGGDEQHDEVLFRIYDTGIGIPPDRIGHLFSPFTQLDATITRKHGGTGLGLAISKELVQLMGGKIWAKSKGIPGQGSEFSFAVQAEPAFMPVPIYLQRNDPILSGKQVLFVGDGEINYKVLAILMAFWGMQIQILDTRSQTLSWLEKEKHIDMVVRGISTAKLDVNSLIEEIYQRCGPQIPPTLSLPFVGENQKASWTGQLTNWVNTPIKPARLYNQLVQIFSYLITTTEEQEVETDAPQAHPLRVLIADDDPTNRIAILLRLHQLGYRPRIASNGLEVIAALESEPFDVILMDLQMPEMNGISTTSFIRESMPVERQPFIIALTADTRQEAKEAMMSEGVDLYITKPMHSETLAQALEQVSVNRKIEGRLPSSPMTTPASDEATNDAIDETVLADFISAMGENATEAVAELLDSFFDNAPELMTELKIAAAEEDWSKLKWTAHALKGNCELLGATRLAQLCKQLENELTNGNVSDATRRTMQIETEFTRVQEALSAKRAQL